MLLQCDACCNNPLNTQTHQRRCLVLVTGLHHTPKPSVEAAAPNRLTPNILLCCPLHLQPPPRLLPLPLHGLQMLCGCDHLCRSNGSSGLHRRRRLLGLLLLLLLPRRLLLLLLRTLLLLLALTASRPAAALAVASCIHVVPRIAAFLATTSLLLLLLLC